MSDKLDLLLKQHQQRKSITEDAAAVERLRLQGKTITEIADATGLDRKMINAHMRGFRTKQKGKNNV